MTLIEDLALTGIVEGLGFRQLQTGVGQQLDHALEPLRVSPGGLARCLLTVFEGQHHAPAGGQRPREPH